jgi:hypothetical protein
VLNLLKPVIADMGEPVITEGKHEYECMCRCIYMNTCPYICEYLSIYMFMCEHVYQYTYSHVHHYTYVY